MDRQDGTEALTQFIWERQPEAERLVRELVEEFLRRCPEAARLAERMKAETGTRFVDWVDSIEVSAKRDIESTILKAGFMERPDYAREGEMCWSHPRGVFPL